MTTRQSHPPVTQSGLHSHDTDQRLARKWQFFSLLLRCTGRSRDVDGPALSQILFPIVPLIRTESSVLINATATIKRRNARKRRRKLQESQSSGRRKPRGLLFTVSQAWEAREEWKNEKEFRVMEYFKECLARPLVGGDI